MTVDIFQRNLLELVMYGYKDLHRGDLNENDNFEPGKLVTHGYIFCMKAILTKIIFLSKSEVKRIRN